jgi:hypothetical protein
MNHIKAILIDPIKREVVHCDVPQDSEGSTYAGLRALVFQHGDRLGYLEHVHVGVGHGLYIDEEGMLTDWDGQAFFDIGGLTVAGVAVLVGSPPDGDTADCRLPIELVQSKITWLHPKEVRVPAPFMQTFDEQGNDEVTLLSGRGVEYWTYDNQP